MNLARLNLLPEGENRRDYDGGEGNACGKPGEKYVDVHVAESTT